MDALAYLQDWAKNNRPAASILFGGIACFAAVAVISKFGVDLQSSIPSVVYIVGFGAGLFLLARLFDQPVAVQAASIFVAVLIAVWILAFFWSKAHPRDDNGIVCAVYFWMPCDKVADRVALDNPIPQITLAQPSAQPTAQAMTPSIVGQEQYSVYIQFAGFDRPTIIDLADKLTQQGWKVEGKNSGGQRVGTAAHLAEVRYKDATSRPVAESLAAALNSSRISNKVIKAVQLSIIAPNTLEVWIGQ